MQTIGTCSLCGGAVQVPMFWGGSVPPTPRCSNCNATKKNVYGGVIDMEAETASDRAHKNLKNILINQKDSPGVCKAIEAFKRERHIPIEVLFRRCG